MTPADCGPVAAGEPHAWVRLAGGWHVGFWGITGLATVWSLVTRDLPGSERTQALGLLGLLAATYAATVQRGLLERVGQARVYLAVAVVVAGLCTSLHPALTMLLFLVYSQGWVLSSGRLEGAAWSTALTVSALLGFVSLTGWSRESFVQVAPGLVVGLLFSMLLGFWISGIIDQSRERAELITQLEQARAELAVAERARGVAEERQRLAREIHDTLAQGFTSVVMLAQAAAPLLGRDPVKAGQQLALIEDVARENLAEARALVAASAPAVLDGATLPDAVRRLADRFAQETGVEVEADLAPVTRLDRDREVVVLRAVQEALSNVRRHAAARRVGVRLHEDAHGTIVEVGDDGAGFGPERRGAGYGLSGMLARVAEVGGELDVASVPGGGTRLTVRLPP